MGSGEVDVGAAEGAEACGDGSEEELGGEVREVGCEGYGGMLFPPLSSAFVLTAYLMELQF